MQKIIRLCIVIILLQLVIGGARATNVEVTSQCQAMHITPEKPTYKPGDTITVTVKGQGAIANILVRYAPAKRNITQTPVISTEITGTYDQTTQMWTGQLKLPQDGEYIIMPNLVQPNGQICAGNPAYSKSTRQGTMAGSGITPGTTPCTGCHKTIVVDSTYGTGNGEGVYNMKDYWQLAPGNYWIYEGENIRCGTEFPTDTIHPCVGDEGHFETRVATEEKVKLAGLTLLPLRFTKTKSEGYMFPNRSSTLRIFLSYFQDGAPWSSSTLGRPFALEYEQPNPSGIQFLGNLIGSVRHYSNEANIDFDNFYYAPQFLGKEFMSVGWHYEAIDRIYFFESAQKIYSGNLEYKSQIRERWADNQLFYEDHIVTPAYTGPALRLRLFEAGYPIGSGWHIREDWYFAKGIGRVRLDSKSCQLALQKNAADPDCSLTSTTKMQTPDLVMNLKNYYLGGPLTTSVSIDDTGKIWTLTATSAVGKYTGYLEIKSCIAETRCDPGSPGKWGYGDGTYIWVDNGIATVDTPKVAGLTYGVRHAWFRPLDRASTSRRQSRSSAHPY